MSQIRYTVVHRLTTTAIAAVLTTGCAALPGGEQFYAEKPFEPPRGYSGGVVLAELFVPGSSSFEVVFGQLDDFYPDEYLVLLAYHVPIPPPSRYWRGERIPDGLNLLAGPAAAERAEYYGVWEREAVLVDGVEMPLETENFDPRLAQSHYTVLRNRIDRELKFTPPVTLGLTVDRRDDTFVIAVDVTPEIDLEGHDLVLRIALVQNEARSPAWSGPLSRPGEYEVGSHPYVVRHLAGGGAGIPVVLTDPTFRTTVTVTREQIETQLHQWLVRSAEDLEVPEELRQLLNRRENIPLDELSVVAFVQREQDKRILQAALWRQ